MLSRRRQFLLFYLLLLVVSNSVRYILPVDDPLPAHKTAAFVNINSDAPDKPVRLAYADSHPGDGELPVVVLLHGSPSSGSLDMLVPSLRRDYRVIAPDLPGFGASSLRVPNYSMTAHATYVVALLDQLDIVSAHFVAYSMGGGVSLQIYEQAPQRVSSIAFISAIGVQELELFGDYGLNHAIHALQLGLLSLIEWGVPHFGYLDDAILNTTYARNFYDSDQRPMRAILTGFEPPFLLIHGRDDSLVPLAAAEEHHRIVAHSEILSLDGGHGMIFSRGDELGAYAGQFIARVVDGTAPRRAQASKQRLALASEPFDWRKAIAVTGVGLFVMLLLLALATYVSEDLTCIAAGLLVAKGALSFWPATLACLVGIYTGDLLLYYAGRHLGRPAMHRAPIKWMIGERGIEAAKMWFIRSGPTVILASRLVPGTRLPTYLAAGALGTSFWKFSAYFLIAAIIWTPMLVGTAAALGNVARQYFERFASSALPLAAAMAMALFLALRILLPLTSSRGRRLLLSRWRRLIHWEFWPAWIFYSPVAAYVAYLGIRHRGFTLFTAANPAIPAGGFVGESKLANLNALRHAQDFVCATALLPDGDTDTSVKSATEFMRAHKTDFPVVLKPDVGQRGTRVRIINDAGQLREYIAEHAQQTLIQVYSPGHEFDIFYIRHPDAHRGSIFTITDKKMPSVTGDGRQTLERLILADDRAVCMMDTFLDRHAAKLFDVPAAGQVVPLAELGTHCKGCMFLDGEWARTDALESTIDRIAKGFDGFYFGCFDIRTPSVDDLMRGENFKIVELNGVAAEATSIYDPRNRLLGAYRTLFTQWRHAFQIGAHNRSRGTATMTFRALLALTRRNRFDNRRAEESSSA